MTDNTQGMICKCDHDDRWHIYSDGPGRRPCVNSPCICSDLEHQ